MSPPLSVLTLVRGREAHLRNVVAGLARSSLLPNDIVVCVMGDEVPRFDHARLPFPVTVVEALGAGGLPLAAARNAAARAARTDRLLFLDVDCIPARGALAAYARAGEEAPDAILMGGVRYLDPGAVTAREGDAELRRRSRPHATRPLPTSARPQIEPRAELFWSLSFALSRQTFERLGGFDERFAGYGAEDTDFAFRAREAGIPLAWVAAAEVFHQHHPSCDPPLEHLRDIAINAGAFVRGGEPGP